MGLAGLSLLMPRLPAKLIIQGEETFTIRSRRGFLGTLRVPKSVGVGFFATITLRELPYFRAISRVAKLVG
jgi:hypothetical protein